MYFILTLESSEKISQTLMHMHISSPQSLSHLHAATANGTAHSAAQGNKTRKLRVYFLKSFTLIVNCKARLGRSWSISKDCSFSVDVK